MSEHSDRLELLETYVGNGIRFQKTDYDKMSVITFLPFRSKRYI